MQDFSSPTYVLCPPISGETREQSLVNSDVIAVMLRECGYEETEDRADTAPDLIVFAPRIDDLWQPSVSVVDLQRHLKGLLALTQGRILFLDPRISQDDYTMYSVAASGSDRARIFGNRLDASDCIEDLFNWLKQGKRASQAKRADMVASPEAVKNLLEQFLCGKDCSPNKLAKVLKFAEETFLGANSEIISFNQDVKWWEVLYILMCIAPKYNRLEHDLNAQGRYAFDDGGKDFENISKQRALLDAANDLLRSLAAFEDLHLDATECGNAGILFIDDNADAIRADLKLMFEALAPGYACWLWNPTHPSVVEHFGTLRKYESLHQSPKINLGGSLDELISKGNVKKPDTLGKALAQSRYVLVDLLFKVDGVERDYGAQLIRGLRRISMDAAKEAPRFIVFSRADDISKIQRALRAGASNYVLKNRLLGLPAVLSEVRHSVAIGATLRRNFYALQKLPNETVGLLKTLRIPKLAVHRTGCIKEGESPSVYSERISDLLRAIPKPDLHLHVGSCMTPEFLIVASVVMLSRLAGVHDKNDKEIDYLKDKDGYYQSVKTLFSFWAGSEKLTLNIGYSNDLEVSFSNYYKDGPKNSTAVHTVDPVEELGQEVRGYLKKCVLAESKKGQSGAEYSKLRSLLHARLKIRDHWTAERVYQELDTRDAVSLMVFALSVGTLGDKDEKLPVDRDDIVRWFILFLTLQYNNPVVNIAGVDILTLMKPIADSDSNENANAFWPQLLTINKAVKQADDSLRKAGWVFASQRQSAAFLLPLTLEVDLHIDNRWNLLRPPPAAHVSPLEYACASGTRGRNLAEYLAGCEYSGAEHLKRPSLLYLYADQTVEYLIRHGIIYAELRAAISGYFNDDIGFSYQDAGACLQAALKSAQTRAIEQYSNNWSSEDSKEDPDGRHPNGMAWCTGLSLRSLFTARMSAFHTKGFPVKINLILTGKRHKATREMMTEAAAGVLLNARPAEKSYMTSKEYCDRVMTECRMAGFDLAGLEESFPPELFRSQFEQLSRLHIPITVHAGENASSAFVESAVLDLRAKRIGHGLALVDDPKLMARVREDKLCIELCPVSNYQTNQFRPPNAKQAGRKYPLQKFMDNGNSVCLNTDNPIISFTNIVKEFFQASYSLSPQGLSLWDALRMIRMGFVHAFMSMPERRALMELVDQLIFDLMTDPHVESCLRGLEQDQ